MVIVKYNFNYNDDNSYVPIKSLQPTLDLPKQHAET